MQKSPHKSLSFLTTMFKTLILVAILCHSSLLISCDDNEFAEFDESLPIDASQVPLQQAGIKQHQPLSIDEKDYIATKKADDVGKKNRKEPESIPQVTPQSEDYSGQSSKKPDLQLVNVPSIKQFRIESYYIEIIFVLGTLLYLVNFFVGSAKNLKFAQSWYEQSRELLKQQFVLVGGAPTFNDPPGAQKKDDEMDGYLASLKKQRGLIKVSESLFTIWNSGRVGMEGLLIEISLLKRQDLFSMGLNLIRASKDNLTLRFALGQESYENFVFCIAHRTHVSRLFRDMVDINTFCPKRKQMSQYDQDIGRLVVMSELSDVSSFILDQSTINFLKKYERKINYIHITDHFSTDRSEELSAMQKLANPKRIATFSFTFPGNAEERTEYILFSLALLDRLRRFKLARDSKQKSEKNRQKITDYLQKAAFNLRQEAAQAKKEELRRLEKERIYNEDDPEKQRRWEKKEAKREQRRNKTRVKQLRVKSTM